MNPNKKNHWMCLLPSRTLRLFRSFIPAGKSRIPASKYRLKFTSILLIDPFNFFRLISVKQKSRAAANMYNKAFFFSIWTSIAP